jgi:Zn-dependent protease with chaperone function
MLVLDAPTADLVLHLPLQEHLVGLLMAQQQHNHVMQALAAVIAAAASLLLAAAGASTLWPVQLAGWALLAAVVVLAAPRLLEAVPGSIAADMLGRKVQLAEGPLDTCRTLVPQPSNKGAPKLDRVRLRWRWHWSGYGLEFE